MNIKNLLYFKNSGYKQWICFLIIFLVLNLCVTLKNSEFSINFKSLFILISLGIFISIENIEKKFLKPTPSLLSTILGVSLLLLVFSNSLFDNYIYKNLDKVITPIIVLSMALVNKPIKNILKFYKTFLISMLPFLAWYFYTPLMTILTPITTIFTWFSLNIFINNVQISLPENYIIIDKNIIEIYGSCSGVGQLFWVLSILIIFLLEFNILKFANIIKMILIAILIPFLINIFRINLLTLITISSLGIKENLFDFFHVGLGSVLFSLISCTIFASMYFSSVRRELINIKKSKFIIRS